MTKQTDGWPRFIATAGVATLILLASAGATPGAEPPRYYLIGNSLTWDTVPSQLDGDVQWHVDCGKSLPYIYAHPEKPCVKSSTLWPKALKETQYDYLVVQPHYGSTLAEDVEVISRWARQQPHATLVIHTGWARQESRAQEYATKSASGKMQHSPRYFRQLIRQLQQRFPDREIRQTHAIDLLDRIAQDIAYLTDRVLVAEHKPQRFGTQLDSKFQPLAIEDAVHVDARRATLGLPTMAEYLKMARSVYEKMSRPQEKQIPNNQTPATIKK